MGVACNFLAKFPYNGYTVQPSKVTSMKNFWKSVTTMGIWVLCSGISITALVTGNSGTFAILIPLVAATFSTLFLWDEGKSSDDIDIDKPQKAPLEKSKRGGNSGGGDKMNLLMQLMDDDERQAFKEALKQQVLSQQGGFLDGELPYDADVFDRYEEDLPAKRLRG
jgi:hypothetical protein